MSESEVAPATEETVASAPETAAPASEESSEDTSTSASSDAELSKVWRRMNPDRSESSREGTNDPESGSETDNVPAQEQKAEAEPEIPVPQSWSAEAKAAWDKVPPEARAIIAKREAEAHQAITSYGQKVKALEPIQEIVEQGRPVFDKYGVDAKTGISQLINANNYLERDPVNAIRDLAAAYGLTLEHFTGQPGTAASPEAAAMRAEIQDLRRQLQHTDHRLVSREQAESQRQLQTIENQVAEFAADKPDFAELADDVEEQILALKTKNPNLDVREVLQKAYDRARKINPEVASRLEAEQKANAEKKRLEEVKKRATEAKKAAPLNVASTPANTHNPRSMDDTLREVARKAYRR